MPTTTPHPGTTGSPNPVDLSNLVKSLINQGSPSALTGHNTGFVMQDGTFKTGGNPSNGRLGTGDYQTVQVRPLSVTFAGEDIGPVVSANMWGGGCHILTESGDVWGWGFNNEGQVGDNSTVQRNYPKPLHWGSNPKPRIIKMANTDNGYAGGSTSIYAIDDQANLWVWGYNGYGQLGVGNTTSSYFAPYKTSLSGVVDVAAGGGHVSHAMVRLQNGDVYAAGYNNYGQTGIGSTSGNVLTWTRINLPGPCVKFSTSAYYEGGTYGLMGHSLWLLEDGRVFAAGNNTHGQIGNSTTTHANSGPVEITSLNNIVDIWNIGEYHGSSMAVDANGNLFGWGRNGYGELGLGDTTQRTVPTLNPIKDVVTVRFGGTWSYRSSLLLTKHGEVYSAGYNGYGQCGLGHMSHQHTHEKVHLPQGIQGKITQINTISTGSGHASQFLDRNGHVWACGYNIYHILCVEPSMGDLVCIPQKVMF